jgi:hypothetical protein
VGWALLVAQEPVSGWELPVEAEPVSWLELAVGPEPVPGRELPVGPEPVSWLELPVGQEPLAGRELLVGPELAVTAKAVPPPARMRAAAMPAVTSDRVRRRAPPRMIVVGAKFGASALFAKSLMAFTNSFSKGVYPVQPEGRASFDVIGVLPWAAVVKGRRAMGTDA